MRIAVWADEDMWNELGVEESETILRVDENACFTDGSINGFIQLNPFHPAQNIPTAGNKPYVVNDVLLLSSSLSHPSVVPFNGWKGFVGKENWETAGPVSSEAVLLLNHIQKKALPAPAVPGFISPRVIAMIINEAWFALEEKVSSKEDIDTAMKLGTNYPFGPFEWGNLIGISNVYALLKRLEQINPIYAPAPLLTKEVQS